MAKYTDVKDPNGVNGTDVNLISADGSTIAGFYSDSAFSDDAFIEQGGVYTDVADPAGQRHSTTITGLSANGGVVVGNALNGAGQVIGFAETGGHYASVIDPNGVSGTFVAAVSGDGSTVAGHYDDSTGAAVGFVENLAAGAYTDVTAPAGATGIFLNAISADGGVVGGYYQTAGGPQGFVETLATGALTEVRDPHGVSGSVVLSLSADGTKAAGYYLSASQGYVSFVENLLTGVYTDVSDPNATSGTMLSAISADGSTVVGDYQNGDGEFGFVETLATGVYTNVDDPNGVQGTLASAVSGDGSIVAGIYGDAADDDVGYFATGVACFGRGASILTLRGEVAVEALAVGDLVTTASGLARPVRWIGRRLVYCARHPEPNSVWPIRVRAGAFAENRPRRDLWLSPEHNIAFEGALIAAGRLVNGRSVVQVERDRFEYWHVELDAHDVIFAEGLAAESYLDTGNRRAFANGGAFVSAHPDFRPKHWTQTCLPTVFEGPPVVRARAQLAERLDALGLTTCEAELRVIADGVAFSPTPLGTGRFAFLLPESCEAPRLVSRTFVPAETVPESADLRTLGVCVARLQIDGAEVGLGDADNFGEGWREQEPGWRWTDGYAALPRGARLVVVDLIGEGRYARASEDSDSFRESGRRVCAASP